MLLAIAVVGAASIDDPFTAFQMMLAERKRLNVRAAPSQEILRYSGDVYKRQILD